MKRLGLRAKFILFLLALLLIIFSLVAFVLIQQNSASLRTTLNEQSKAFTKLATKPIGDAFLLYQDSGRLRIQQQVDKFADLNPDISGVTITDINGKSLFHTGDKSYQNISPKKASSFETLYTYNSRGEIEQVIQPYIEDFGAHRYTIVYAISSQRIDNAILQEKMAIIGLSALAMLITVTLSYLVINRLFVKPVRSVSRLALIISGGNLQQQVVMRRDDEIGDLAKAVNTMATSLKADIIKLQEADKLKSEFMMIASHNLRTPLSIINGSLEMSKSSKLTPEVQKAFDAISANSIRLGSFAEDMLIISTLESGKMVIRQELVELKPLLDKIASDFAQIAAQKQITFSAKVDTEGYQANLSKSHFRSAVWNLLDNAFKFTPGGGKISFEASVKDNHLVVSVNDNGVGIAAAEMPKLFTKFHRAVSTLKYDYEGTGIGLYLTKLIIEQHGGSVSAESTEGQGSLFTITLPLQTPKQQ